MDANGGEMPRKLKLPPDNRLNWRDPNMPVLDDGVEKTPERFQWERTRALVASEGFTGSKHFPNWRNDPGYHGWKKK